MVVTKIAENHKIVFVLKCLDGLLRFNNDKENILFNAVTK